jgi:chromosome segregation ATPase
VDIVQEVASGSHLAEEGDNAVMKSNAFELLGQSIIDPRVEEKKIEAIREELNKRYQPLLKKVVEVSERIESQEELIKGLNRMSAENSQQLEEATKATAAIEKIQAEMAKMAEKAAMQDVNMDKIN